MSSKKQNSEEMCHLSPEVYKRLFALAEKYAKNHKRNYSHYPYVLMLGQHPTTKTIIYATIVPPDRECGGCCALPTLSSIQLAKALYRIIKNGLTLWGIARCGTTTTGTLDHRMYGKCNTITIPNLDKNGRKSQKYCVLASDKFTKPLRVAVTRSSKHGKRKSKRRHIRE